MAYPVEGATRTIGVSHSPAENPDIVRLFVYEYVTGGGAWSSNSSTAPDGSLLREGRAMFESLAEDFSRCGDVEVLGCRDARLLERLPPRAGLAVVRSAAEERDVFERLARAADAVIVIAPESGGALLERVAWAECFARSLWSPATEFVRIATDKQTTAARLLAAGVRAPRGIALTASEPLPCDFRYPAILKPRDGAGSQGVRRLAGADSRTERTESETWRLEELCEGLAASIAVLTGPQGRMFLPALRQRLGGTSGFEYLGGDGPLDEFLQRRAERLASAALDALPASCGYVGLDLVLGESADGGDDFVIEVNPRLTTSYVGLRALCAGNLADAWRSLATGAACHLSFGLGPLEFDADGHVITRQGIC